MFIVSEISLRNLFPGARVRALSSISSPTHEEISHLILQQKSPSNALQTFKWASHLPSFTHDPSTYHALIQSLISFSRLDKAQELLLSIPSPLDSSFIALIRAFGRARQHHNAINLLNTFTPQNPPSLKILNSVLNVLVREDIDLARHFFRKRMHRMHDEHTFGILMKGLCGANRIAEAFKLLQIMKRSVSSKPNPVVYNTLIHGLCRNGKVGRARSLMSEMEELSDVTFHILISAYCSEDNLVQALVMLDKCFQCGFVPDAVTVTKVIDILCRHGRSMEAVELLERVEHKGGVVDVISYNSLIKGFCTMGKPEVGKRVLKEMERKGCLPNVRTYNVLVHGFCSLRNADSAMDVFREMGMVGVAPDFETFDVLIRGYCLEGRVEEGLKVLGMMKEALRGKEDYKRISPYNSVLYGFYREKRMEEAYELLKTLESLFPRAVGRSLRVLGFCVEGEVGEAKMVHVQMVKEGDIPSVLVYISLIEQLSARGCVREAFDLMNEMVERGYFPLVSTFNALICGFCREGNLRSASKLLNEMVSRGCSPDAGSYSPLISALCRQGDIGRASTFLVQMVESGVIPDYSTWNCLIDNDQFGISTENTLQDAAANM